MASRYMKSFSEQMLQLYMQFFAIALVLQMVGALMALPFMMVGRWY